jgi:hypothetical protein
MHAAAYDDERLPLGFFLPTSVTVRPKCNANVSIPGFVKSIAYI